MNEARFRSLWERCCGSDTIGDSSRVYDELRSCYSESHRLYHTGAHIMHCLSQFDLASEFMEEPDAVEMALWFHDAIYDPKKSDNEEKSAELFRGRAGGRADLRFTRKVINLIINTTHREWPYSQDGQLTVDIDLSSLGLPWEVFKNNSRAIRNEYAHLSDKKFAHQQDLFFKSLLSRSSVFASAYFKERYESVARNNIKRLMAKSLDADGSFL